MRELKFRAWVGSENTRFINMPSHYEYDVVLDNGKWADVESGWDIQGTEERVPVEQYTGLKDKNGKEIYENDIIKCYSQDTYPIGKVIYSEEWAGYEIVAYDAEQRVYSLEHFSPIISEYLEVVGTIHENPELLGGGE